MQTTTCLHVDYRKCPDFPAASETESNNRHMLLDKGRQEDTPLVCHEYIAHHNNIVNLWK